MEDDEYDEAVIQHREMVVSMSNENNNTNFLSLLKGHLSIISGYSIKTKDGKKGRLAFSDREMYQIFSVSSFFYLNLKFQVFQQNDVLVTENDFKDWYLPPLKAFHYSDDEKLMHKNRTMEIISKGDIMHLRVISEERNELKLQILNIYGNERRILDDEIFATLLTTTEAMKKIYPPLKESEYVRAAVHGKCKQETGHFQSLLMSLNDSYLKDKDEELKSLHLGRVYKEDIPFFPEDITGYHSFGQYLVTNYEAEPAQICLKHISAMQCDPLKTGPFYDNQKKKNLLYQSHRSEEDAKYVILYDKSKIAEDNLNKGNLEEALFEIEEALQVLPENDAALTLRGKIYLAMAGGKPSSKIRKAMMDFEAALKANNFNEEAAAFHDLLIMESVNRFSQNNMTKEAEELRFHLKNPNQVNVKAEAFMEDIKNGKYTKKTPITDAVTLLKIEDVTHGDVAADNSINIAADILGEKPMDWY